MQIISVYQYAQNQIIGLPYYGKYDAFTQTMILYVDKQFMGESITNEANINTILLKTAIPLTSTSFLYE